MGKKHDAGSTPAGGEHRWAVDQVEEGTAAVEQDRDHVYQIPRWLLPDTARDGDVFTASRVASGDGSVTITVRLEQGVDGPTKAGKAKRTRPTSGGAGDIAL
jgi:hypothetical protein